MHCKYRICIMQIQCKYNARKPCSDFCDMQVHMQVPVLACINICKPDYAESVHSVHVF